MKICKMITENTKNIKTAFENARSGNLRFYAALRILRVFKARARAEPLKSPYIFVKHEFSE